MRLLSSSVKLSGLLTLLFLLASTLSVSWSSFGPQLHPGATLAWAGSPDETLNPPPEPPKKGTSYGYATTVTTDATYAKLESKGLRTELSWTERIGIVWNYYLSKVLRF